MSKNPKKKGAKVVLWSVLTVVFAVLLVASIYGTNLALASAQAVNIFMKTSTYKVVGGDESAVYFESDFDSVEELEAYDKQIAEQLQAEGAVLLMNNNNALPLSTSEKISTFGHSSVNVATCGTGSADIDTSKGPSLKEALEAEGFEVNPTLWDFYVTNADAYPSNPVKGMDGIKGYNRADYCINEIPADVYTDEVKSSFTSYGDVAIVVITRLGGELTDMPVEEFTDGTNVLALTEEEQDMLKMINDAGFSKTIVLINSTNAMECDFLYNEEYGIDACLWIGYTGTYGLNGIADLLSGAANPSGRLVDTYCYDNTTCPAMVGFYGSTYANADTEADSRWYKISSLDGNMGYLAYQEGIYIGYRYYETRYEDTVMGTGNAGSYVYTDDVAFAFGYGLSYTTFDWSNFSVSYDAASDAFVVNVTVTNTGSVAGKDVVEIYFQSPYTDYDKQYGIEKASIELCGFAKTATLEPGASETVEVVVPRSELTSYDSHNAKTYILDAGTYYLTAGTDAHDALNNVLSAKGYTTENGMTADGNIDMTYAYEVATLDAETYSVSSTGYTITNQFDNTELSYYGLEDLTYLSRSDWQGTWPQEVTLEANEAMMADLYTYQTYTGIEGSTTEMPTMGADNGITLGMMIGKDYDDPNWDLLLDQITFTEMADLIGKGYHNTAMVVSASKPSTLDDNGPQGFTQALTGVSTCHCAYSDENIMAATWNVDLMYEVGRCLGNDMLDLGASGLYGPAMNTHRTAYGGRNFEYYSEDGFLAGAIAAAEIQGIQSKGVYVYIKHFALNDVETACRCISTWVNEQAIREIYLKPFQMSVEDGDAHAVMNAFSRFGAVWSGGHYGLMTEVLYNEWGFDGFAITDFSGNSMLASYGLFLKTYDVVTGLMAGTSTWDSSATQWTDDLINLYQNDADVVAAMRLATKRILYTVANSNAMNGFDADTAIKAATPWWDTALHVLCVAMAVMTAFSAVKLVLAIRKKVKMSKQAS